MLANIVSKYRALLVVASLVLFAALFAAACIAGSHYHSVQQAQRVVVAKQTTGAAHYVFDTEGQCFEIDSAQHCIDRRYRARVRIEGVDRTLRFASGKVEHVDQRTWEYSRVGEILVVRDYQRQYSRYALVNAPDVQWRRQRSAAQDDLDQLRAIYG